MHLGECQGYIHFEVREGRLTTEAQRAQRGRRDLILRECQGYIREVREKAATAEAQSFF